MIILSWNYNDNYKSVNSKVFLNEFTNVNIMNINNFEKKIKFDLFEYSYFRSYTRTYENIRFCII